MPSSRIQGWEAPTIRRGIRRSGRCNSASNISFGPAEHDDPETMSVADIYCKSTEIRYPPPGKPDRQTRAACLPGNRQNPDVARCNAAHSRADLLQPARDRGSVRVFLRNPLRYTPGLSRESVRLMPGTSGGRGGRARTAFDIIEEYKVAHNDRFEETFRSFVTGDLTRRSLMLRAAGLAGAAAAVGIPWRHVPALPLPRTRPRPPRPMSSWAVPCAWACNPIRAPWTHSCSR